MNLCEMGLWLNDNSIARSDGVGSYGIHVLGYTGFNLGHSYMQQGHRTGVAQGRFAYADWKVRLLESPDILYIWITIFPYGLFPLSGYIFRHLHYRRQYLIPPKSWRSVVDYLGMSWCWRRLIFWRRYVFVCVYNWSLGCVLWPNYEVVEFLPRSGTNTAL